MGTLLSILTASTVVAAPTPAKTTVFYVAPGGNDAWSGTRAAPNREKTDGPFATPQRARDAIRALKQRQGGALKQPVTVYLRGGLYCLAEPLVLTPEDSGTAECPVTWAAYPDELPALSGGRRITGWQPVTLDGKALWAAEVPEARDGGWFFHQLWINGTRRIRARYPNRGYLEVAENPDPDEGWGKGQKRFRFKEGDLKAWATVSDAEVVVANRWVESHLPVERVDEAERMVHFTKRSVFRLDPGDKYYIEHALELLDQPGEWYLDRKTGTLYTMPFPGEDPAKAEAVAPALSQVVRLEGTPELGLWVEHLKFEGLKFAHTEWYFPADSKAAWFNPEVGGFAQAAVGVPGAVYGEGVQHVAFERCGFLHLGTYGIELGRGCRNNRIHACEFSDLAAGGVKIGETQVREQEAERTYGNEVSDCYLHHGGRIFHSAIGIWCGQSYNNRFLHNHIHDFYYSGFSLGWTWGYGPALGYGNLVEGNHVHHIGVQSDGDGPILSDMAGIYTLGLQEGTVIRGNLWHDVAGLRYGGWGIYFDEGTTRIVAENNLVYRTTHGSFHQHYGKENVVRNNIFAFARDWQIQASRPEEHQRFTLEGNIVYWDQGPLLSGNLSDFHFGFDRNLYWQTKGEAIQPAGLTWEEWQAKGMDRGSRIADPLFEDPEHDNFTLKPGSPALELGFKPFDLKDVGPRVPVGPGKGSEG